MAVLNLTKDNFQSEVMEADEMCIRDSLSLGPMTTMTLQLRESFLCG